MAGTGAGLDVRAPGAGPVRASGTAVVTQECDHLRPCKQQTNEEVHMPEAPSSDRPCGTTRLTPTPRTGNRAGSARTPTTGIKKKASQSERALTASRASSAPTAAPDRSCPPLRARKLAGRRRGKPRASAVELTQAGNTRTANATSATAMPVVEQTAGAKCARSHMASAGSEGRRWLKSRKSRASREPRHPSDADRFQCQHSSNDQLDRNGRRARSSLPRGPAVRYGPAARGRPNPAAPRSRQART